MSLAKATDLPRWRNNDLTLIVMDVGADGEGEGQLAIGVTLRLDPESKGLFIEDFHSEPLRLTDLHRRQ